MWLIILLLLTMIFGLVVLFGNTYLPILKIKRLESLEFLDLKLGQTLLDLVCGDGRMLAEAVKQGINAIGYEKPILNSSVKLVTYTFKILVKKPLKKKNVIFLYIY